MVRLQALRAPARPRPGPHRRMALPSSVASQACRRLSQWHEHDLDDVVAETASPHHECRGFAALFVIAASLGRAAPPGFLRAPLYVYHEWREFPLPGSCALDSVLLSHLRCHRAARRPQHGPLAPAAAPRRSYGSFAFSLWGRKFRDSGAQLRNSPPEGGIPPHLPLLTDGPAHAESTL